MNYDKIKHYSLQFPNGVWISDYGNDGFFMPYIAKIDNGDHLFIYKFVYEYGGLRFIQIEITEDEDYKNKIGDSKTLYVLAKCPCHEIVFTNQDHNAIIVKYSLSRKASVFIMNKREEMLKMKM